jgi:enoyl-CoA hydratase
MMQEAIQIVENLLDCPKPVLSAVNGYAMGLGANFALLCDVVVASKSAVFADTHVKLGIGAGDGGQVIWPLLMGVNRAKYYLMTGDRVTASEAERLGLVNFVVEPEDLLDRTLEIAERLARGPSMAIAASKVPLNRWIKTMVQEIMPLSLAMEDACFGSEDAVEAGRAFVEKREPVFAGR